MAIPSKKSSEMAELLENIMGRSTHIKNNTCAWCGRLAKVFRDKLSEKEFTISGLCQACQDKVFGKD